MDYMVYIPEEAKPDEQNLKVQISQWLLKIGQSVEKGVELVEICTDKAVYVITAPVSGILKKVLIEEGQFFSPDNPICIINIKEE
ncbi:MAG TPA: lipoyl domain-containing protein [Candidatus Hydrogenedens sp.]|nr:lipoyl domain-containing protein [Candidatus Hydrogenedens sp.]